MKFCAKCNTVKENEEFYVCSRSKDKMQSHCKTCQEAYRIAHRKRAVELSRRWARNNPISLEVLKERRDAHIEEFRKYRKDYYKKNPLKQKAHQKVARAIRSGILPWPSDCACGATGVRYEYHHACYDNPLEVESMCVSCHKKEHRRLNDLAKGIVS